MPVRFGLIENHLTADPGDYMAVVTDNDTFTEDGIIDRMISRGSTVTKAEALSVLEEYGLALEDILKGGNNVNTKLFSIYPSIAGVFNGQSDGFDKSRHAVRLNITSGSRLNKIIGSIQVQRVELTSPAPVLQKFTNLRTKTINESFTPGQIASIAGLMLKFDEADPLQGIFFIAADSTETRVSNVSKNKPSELLFFVPDSLTTGTYQVEVRSILHGRKTLSVGRLLNNLVPVS
ncbi:MAG: DUF4469 domain-containing protein [Bacteroidales bacterium]|nr:DUF4469 domain-containing protein [Bacteroidales bacterium]